MTDVKGSILGNAVLRKEDPGLLVGDRKYSGDLDAPGALHVHFVRSPFAHATLGNIDSSAAAGMPGVKAVYTADSFELPPFLGFPMMPPETARPMLATGKVRYVGDIVAMVIAESLAQAQDAAENVVVDYDPLPVLTSAKDAIADGAPVLIEAHGSNIVFATAVGAGDDDPDPMEGAEHIAECSMYSQRLAGVPMEPNGCVAIPDGDSIDVWISSQNPVAIKEPLVGLLGLDPDNVRVVAPAVGGGFGPKAGAYSEFMLTTKAALELGTAVRWTEIRSENMVNMVQGRDMFLDAKLGLTKDGMITGLDVNCVADAGAYPGIGAILPLFTQTMAQGVYAMPVLRFNGVTATTNKTPIGAYRGAGRPEATQVLERVMDIAAMELGIDPAELRRKNFLQPEDFPLTTHGGANYDCGEYEKALDAALEAAGYADMRAEQAARREAGDAKQIGIGVSSYVEVTAPAGMHVEYGAVEINEDGSVTARVGTSSHGQGHDTAFSMIVSDMLGVDMQDVTLLQSDTNEIPRGTGTMGSRSLQTAGSAVHVASETVLAKAKQLAAHMLEASESDIETADGGLQVAGVPAKALSWADLAAAANDDSKRPEGMEPGLSHELDFDGSDSTFPFGSHVSMVEVDTDTGEVTMLRHIAVDDCGKIVNPMLVQGQQHGGIAQGAAQALFEQVVYDEAGNPITSNLMDYAIPSAAELINFEASNTETPSPRNPLGAKGIGESGTIGSTPAIHNAVIDAVSHMGVKHMDMPLTAETVWSAINAAN